MQLNDSALGLLWKKFQLPSTYVCAKAKYFWKVQSKFKVLFPPYLKGRKCLCSNLAGRFFSSYHFYLKMQSRQGDTYSSCFLCIFFSPPPVPLFGRGFAVIRNDTLLTCGSPLAQKWLTENDKCKKEDTDDSYGTHKHCIHVQIWNTSTAVVSVAADALWWYDRKRLHLQDLNRLCLKRFRVTVQK